MFAKAHQGFGNLKELLSNIKDALENDDGRAFASLMSLKHPYSKQYWDIKFIKAEPPFDMIAFEHIQCSNAYMKRDYESAFQHQCKVVQLFAKMFPTQKEDNWGLPLMSVIIKDLYHLGLKAGGKSGENTVSKLDICADMLMAVFRVCAGDSRTSLEYTKRWGMMTIINLLFKCYFRTNKLHLCKPLIRTIESSNIKDEYTIADRVTYNYFVGKKYMYENEFKGANKCLSFAFENCHKHSVRNKRRILIYLIPVKVSLGNMPKLELLRKYNLSEFEGIVTSVKHGDIRTLNATIEKYSSFFIEEGIYLVLEKLKVIALRNLFKKIYMIINLHQLDVSLFQCALNYLGMEDVDCDETECILANMIADGYIKGYLSEQHKKMVVSKVNAFPKLNTFL